MKKIVLTCALALIALNGCSTYRGTENVSLSSKATFALIPFVNHSNTPMAGDNVKTIVSSELKARNMRAVTFESVDEPQDLKSILDENFERRQAEEWLKNISCNYVITGSVDEWNYKAGLDGEPAVSITVEIRDANGAVLFQKTGSRSGYGRESLNLAGQKVVEKLFDGISLN